jgi:hypothetical protein
LAETIIMKIGGWLGFVFLGALTAACGSDDDKPAAQPASVNKQLAVANTQDTITALSASLASASADVGPAIATSLAVVAEGSQRLLQAQGGSATTQSTASALTGEPTIHPLDLGGPGCTCTANDCTFTNCSFASGDEDGSQFSFAIDGSYSWGNGHVRCDHLKYTFDGSSAGGEGATGYTTNVVVTLDCDMTISATSLKGFLQSAGSTTASIAGQSTQGTYSSNWDVKTTYNDVTFDSTHEPTGGSIHVEGTTSVSVGSQTQSFAGSADVTFPAN